VLEPYDGKLSRTVLRGLGGRNAPRLPGASNSTGNMNFIDYRGGVRLMVLSFAIRRRGKAPRTPEGKEKTA
jgi:hypothetical protein